MDSSSSLKGIELGKLVLSSGLLHTSWSKISTCLVQDSALTIKKDTEEKVTFVVFEAPPISGNGSLDTASTLLSGSPNENPFHFLCSEKISEFSLHSHTLQIFTSAHETLSNLKSELLALLESKKSVIITGAGLGGSVASLFTLWLLENVKPGKKRPLCITFGSPLIGDTDVQQILENSVRNSCFLHVADAAQTPIMAGFKPFGTFLFFLNSECICIDDVEVVMKILVHTDLVDYRKILQRLDQPVLSMADSELIPDDVINLVESAAKKKRCFDPSKDLNGMKIRLMYIEQYKKKSKDTKIVYYDRFKNQPKEVDVAMERNRQRLNSYWKSVVEEGEKMPHTEISFLSRRYLYAANNYRRIIEPLDIADYYRQGRKAYQTTGRPPHYVMLKKWFGEDSNKTDKKLKVEGIDLSNLLMNDSCFWAEVEEAIIVINQMKSGMSDEALMGKLVRFEEYVWEMIGKSEVSPEIFLTESSFMRWWKEYEDIKKQNGSTLTSSHFTEFMSSRKYETYGQSAK